MADFNKDGFPDIAVGAGSSVYLLIQSNSVRGTFVNEGPVASAGGTVAGIASGDFNEDGKPDLVVSTNSALLFFPGNGNGTFGAGQSIAGGAFGAILVGKFNSSHDQHLDLAANGGAAAVILLGDGTGHFSLAPNVRCNGDISALAEGDFNGDGKPDLACGENVWIGNGGGGFTQSATLTGLNGIVFDTR
ncbi:MAG: hypothetical protein C5B51_03070 [Terriglobia bacterium]|nr:MAG: hypothetical protein C5B51_03070 [Terriglobia bacterium]